MQLSGRDFILRDRPRGRVRFGRRTVGFEFPESRQMLNSTSVAHDDSYVVREHMVRPRYYDPKTGWFLSHDPSGIEASGDYNVDRDAGNNPLNASAPTGVRTFHLGLRRPM